MSATTLLVLGGVLVAFQLFIVFALIKLSRRVAQLEGPIQPLGEEVGRRDDEPGVANEGPGAGDDEDDDEDAPHISMWDLSAGTAARPKRTQPAVDLAIEAEEQRALEAMPFDRASFDEAVTAYNALASHFGRAELQAFEQRWHPESVARDPENWLTDDPEGDFWLIRTGDAGDPHGLVVPGPEIVRKWELYYRSMDSLIAKNLLEGLYAIKDGAPLRLGRPAIARESDKGWRVSVPGKFADD